jgi:uncharacterized RDD family membrane protein YckC
MRCPKCQYLGFDGQDRCRNCGYDMSLSQTLPESAPADADAASAFADVPMARAPEPRGAGVDLPLRQEPTARERARAAIRQRQAASRPGGDPFDLPLFAGAPEARVAGVGPGSDPEPGELRLHDAAAPPDMRVPEPRLPASRRGDSFVDDRPFISASPTPRPPLAVRRPTGDGPRARAGTAPAVATVTPAVVVEPAVTMAAVREPAVSDRASGSPTTPVTTATPSFDVDAMSLGGEAPSASVRHETHLVSPDHAAPTDEVSHSGASPLAAPIPARVLAGLIDIAILGALDLVVVAFTLQLTSVAWRDIGRLPVAPLLAFLALLATGYLTMFTVLAGQTAGKMAMGLRVVEAGGRPVRFGHAVLRAAVQVLTTPLLGIGFLPALLASDRRALYDRLSDTEVIRSDA